jgi:hypothetical protein
MKHTLNKHAWILGLGLCLPACGDDGIEASSADGGATDGTDGTTTTASTTLTTTSTTSTTSTTTPDDTSTTEPDPTETDDDTGKDETAGDETAGDETAGDETAGDGTTGSTTGVEPECTVNDDCVAFDGACTVGVCDAGTCVADNVDDGTDCQSDPNDLCVTGEVCNAGACGGGSMVDCSAFDEGACIIGVCNPQDGQCSGAPGNEGGACDDGEACTYDDICTQGVCAGTSDPIFFETFGDNSQGWTVEGKWEIETTVAGATGTLSGLTDPEFDHTGDAANGVAGVVISDIEGEGGLSGPPGHAAQYLTSPVVDLSVLEADAPKQLHFFRWLVSNSAFANETIDVWNGSEWINVYTMLQNVFVDEWVEISIDISAYTNSDFQVRFGHEIDALVPVGPAEPSWSIDDLAVGPICGN